MQPLWLFFCIDSCPVDSPLSVRQRLQKIQLSWLFIAAYKILEHIDTCFFQYTVYRYKRLNAAAL